MDEQNPEDSSGTKTVPYDTIMVYTGHQTSVKFHRLYNTRNEF